MPTLVTSLQQQQKAAASPNRTYPDMPNLSSDWTWWDEFSRRNLNVTENVELYETVVVGASSVSQIQSLSNLRLLTDNNQNDLVSVATGGLGIARNAFGNIDSKSQVIVEFVDGVGSITDFEFFSGLSTAVTLSARPTVGVHCGVKAIDGGNFILSSGNGAAEESTDTGIAVDTAIRAYRITWTANAVIKIDMFSNSSFNTIVGTHTSTSFTTSSTALLMHWYVENLAALANKSLLCTDWKIIVS